MTASGAYILGWASLFLMFLSNYHPDNQHIWLNSRPAQFFYRMLSWLYSFLASEIGQEVVHGYTRHCLLQHPLAQNFKKGKELDALNCAAADLCDNLTSEVRRPCCQLDKSAICGWLGQIAPRYSLRSLRDFAIDLQWWHWSILLRLMSIKHS